MRFLNFARELSRGGARVYFAVNVWEGDDSSTLQGFLDKLKRDGVIAGSILTNYRYSAGQGRLGALAFYPGLTNWLLRDVRRQPGESLLRFVKENQITAAIVSDRKLLFLGETLQTALPTLYDWTDSMALYYWRALQSKLQKREFQGILGFLRDYQTNLIAEAYYGRRASLNMIVSPVDKAWLDRTNLKAARNRVWMNGTNTEIGAPVAKVPKRLIFSGAMDYPPNYEGALWFLNEVFPLVQKRHPDAEFVIAGINPVPELAARETQHVQITGFVPDLGAEIARSTLYVAPLLSGGGFRNKIIEAIMQGTYLIGTPMSVEFLPSAFRNQLSIADTAEQMASSIVSYLDDPAQYDQRLKELREMVISQFSWRGRTQDLAHFLAEAEAIHAIQRGGRPLAADSGR